MISEEGLKSAFTLLSIYGIFILAIEIVIYIVISNFLNKLNKQIEGKGTILAWIPLFNIYILGKLTINKPVGIILFLYNTFTQIVFPNLPILYQLKLLTTIPLAVWNTLKTINNIAIFILSIYSIIKYHKLKRQLTINGNIQLNNSKESNYHNLTQHNEDEIEYLYDNK